MKRMVFMSALFLGQKDPDTFLINDDLFLPSLGVSEHTYHFL